MKIQGYWSTGDHVQTILAALGGVRTKRLESARQVLSRLWMRNSFLYFKTSPDIIRLVVMMYIRPHGMRARMQWCWHLDEVWVRINGKTYALRRAVDHEGEVLEAFA